MVSWLLHTFVFSLLLCIGKGGKCPIDMVYGAALSGYDNLGQLMGTLNECVQDCQKNPKCNSVDYRFTDQKCDMSSYSLLPLYASTDGWNYMEVNRVRNIQNFLKVGKASLSATMALETVLDTTLETCATTCLLTGTCKSFEISIESPHTCILYKEDTEDESVEVNKDRDFYQLRTSKYPIDIVYGAALSGYDNLGQIQGTFNECVQGCQNNPKCNSMDYRFSDKKCDMSSYSQLPLYASPDGWNYIEVNRVRNIQNFLKVGKASLSPTMALETVLDTTPETCATTCLLTETCKSFEISIESPDNCILYKEDTANKRMKVNQDRDFYQLRKSPPCDNVCDRCFNQFELESFKCSKLTEVQKCLNDVGCPNLEGDLRMACSGSSVLLYTITSGIGVDAYTSFMSTEHPTTWRIPEDCKPGFCSFLRNHLMDWWEYLPIDKVYISVITKNGTEPITLTFDGRSSTSTNWFTLERLESSPWKDLTKDNNRYFSIEGFGGIRRFYIAKKHSGCCSEYGWLSIVEGRRWCKYAKVDSYPKIMVSTLANATLWNKEYGEGTSMKISIRLIQ